MDALDLAEQLQRARQTGDLSALTDAVPYARWQGIRLETVAGERLCRMAYSPKLIGNSMLPALHGGTLGALLESAAVFELLLGTEAVRVPKIVSLTVDFLRSGKPQDVWARATITRAGRRVANVRVEAWQEDRARPIAAAHALFLLAPERAAG